jgi:hypothetical protein
MGKVCHAPPTAWGCRPQPPTATSGSPTATSGSPTATLGSPTATLGSPTATPGAVIAAGGVHGKTVGLSSFAGLAADHGLVHRFVAQRVHNPVVGAAVGAQHHARRGWW